MSLKMKPLTLAMASCALLILSACGGGDDAPAPVVPTPPPTDSGGSPGVPVTPPPADTVTKLSGTVTVNQGIKNAVVCMDINANSACDAGEPTSAKTGADGAYSLSYDNTKITTSQVAAASLIAPMVPGTVSDAATTIDGFRPGDAATTAAYVLRQVPGKSGAINPLTTLVSAGASAGMTEAVARANVAVQLAIAEAKIDNYQDDPSSDISRVADNARSMASVTAAALEAGAVLVVGDRTAAIDAPANGPLAGLRYSDASNFYIRTLDSQAKPAGDGPVLIKDARAGMTNGTPNSDELLYTQAYNSNGVWRFCNAAVAFPVTSGSPSRSTYCNAQPAVGFTNFVDVAGQSMSSAVTAMQAETTANVINNGVPTGNLLAKLGASTFPANAKVRNQVNVNLTQPLYINNISTDGFSTLTTLEQLIAAYPSSGVSLANGGGTVGLGVTNATSTTTLRAAFTGSTSPTAGTVQFYECDYSAALNANSNCKATQAGTYSIAAVGGARALRYAGHPETSMNHTRLHAEVPSILGWASAPSRLYVVRENKPSLAYAQSRSLRLDGTAWGAMRTVLGL